MDIAGKSGPGNSVWTLLVSLGMGTVYGHSWYVWAWQQCMPLAGKSEHWNSVCP